MLVFAAETSCDETSICLMENRSIIDHITFSQEIHKIHGGVVPELASRSHLEKIQIMMGTIEDSKISTYWHIPDNETTILDQPTFDHITSF